MLTDNDIQQAASELRRMGSLHFQFRDNRDDVAKRLKVMGIRTRKSSGNSLMTRNYVFDSGDRTDYGLGNSWTTARYSLYESE